MGSDVMWNHLCRDPCAPLPLPMMTDAEQMDESKKTRKACDQCRSRKVKCDGLPTCTRCVNKGFPCTYNYVFKKRLRKKMQEMVNQPKRRRGRPRKSSIVNSPLVSDRDPAAEAAGPASSNNTSTSNLGSTSGRYAGSLGASTPASTVGAGAAAAVSAQQYLPQPLPLPIPMSTSVSAPLGAAEATFPYPVANNTSFAGAIPSYDAGFYRNTVPSNPLALSQLSGSPAPAPAPAHATEQDSSVEQRLQKMESMISLLLDKVSSKSPRPSALSAANFGPSQAGTGGCAGALSLTGVNLDASSARATSDIASNSNSNTHASFTMNHNTFSGSERSKANDSPQLFESGCSSLTNPESLQKWVGLLMHTSIFFLSPIGMKTLENKMENPEALAPLKQIVQVSTPCERKIISIWTNPIYESQLTPLPSRANIECLLQALSAPFFLLKVLDVGYLKHLLRLYCDFRDGLIPEPYFSYSDYLLMNSSLLVACLVIEEFSEKALNGGGPMPDFKSLREVSDNLLDNALFYYSRLSVISGGVSSIVGSLFLAFYADSISLSRAAYLISSSAIRQAQELGLHIEETYRTLPQHERALRLNIWWACYVFDRELCIRWGQTPVINDNDISAPPLPGFEAYWSPNQTAEQGPSKRSIYHFEIQTLLEPLLENPSSSIDLEQYISTDYAFITAKVYDNFLRAGALKNVSKKEAKERLIHTIAELDYWKESIPKPIRPRTKEDDDKSFYEFIEKLTLTNTMYSLHLMIMATSLHVRYHHVKLMVFRAYTKHCFVEYGDRIDDELLSEPTISARNILHMSCVVDSRFGNYVNYFIFYPFNAFLSICGLYILLEKEPPDLRSDLQLLIDSIKLHFTPFVSNKKHHEKGGMVELVLKGMLYATYVTCKSRFGDIPLEGLEVLDDARAIAEGNKTAAEIVCPVLNMIETRVSPERPLCKLPYFYNQNPSLFITKDDNSHSRESPLHSASHSPIDRPSQLSDIPILVGNDTDRTPNVSFLLSPSHQPTEGNIRLNPANATTVGFKAEGSEDKNPFLSNGAVKLDKDPEPDYFNMSDVNSKDTLFHNMLNIPNYFFDYLYEDTNNTALTGFP